MVALVVIVVTARRSISCVGASDGMCHGSLCRCCNRDSTLIPGLHLLLLPHYSLRRVLVWELHQRAPVPVASPARWLWGFLVSICWLYIGLGIATAVGPRGSPPWISFRQNE